MHDAVNSEVYHGQKSIQSMEDLFNAMDDEDHVLQPWAKCGLFAAAALRPISCSLIVAFSLQGLAIMVAIITISKSNSCSLLSHVREESMT